jgi:hypothetical protein
LHIPGGSAAARDHLQQMTITKQAAASVPV